MIFTKIIRGFISAKHGFTVDELALVMAAFDTHPEAGK
ncbi:arylamine N-acetyltransferase [Escherichia coli]|nr:arylamine N-acetyltransferase [Escherichia coli]